MPGLLRLLLRLDAFPKSLDGLRRRRTLIAEHMRMPAHEFRGDGLDHGAEIERARFLGHAGMKDDLEQEIAQLLLEVGEVVAGDCVRDFVRLFER